MTTNCPICKKSPIMVVTRKKLRGKYNPTGKKRKYPNLQWAPLGLVKAHYGNQATELKGKRVKICTQCRKTIYKAAKIKSRV